MYQCPPPKKTPLRVLIESTRGSILIKDESSQISGAFKYRGSFAILSSSDMIGQSAEVVTASTGNHASGLALAAQGFGRSAVIFVPEGTPEAKIQRISKAGASIRLVKGSYEDAATLAVSYAEDNGAIYIPSFDDPRIIKANSSIAAEVLSELITPPTRFYVPVGGGGLLAGIVTATNPETTAVIGCEYRPYRRLDAILSGKIDSLNGNLPFPPPSMEGITVRGLGRHPLKVLAKARNLSNRQIDIVDMCRAHSLLWHKLEIVQN